MTRYIVLEPTIRKMLSPEYDPLDDPDCPKKIAWAANRAIIDRTAVYGKDDPELLRAIFLLDQLKQAARAGDLDALAELWKQLAD